MIEQLKRVNAVNLAVIAALASNEGCGPIAVSVVSVRGRGKRDKRRTVVVVPQSICA